MIEYEDTLRKQANKTSSSSLVSTSSNEAVAATNSLTSATNEPAKSSTTDSTPKVATPNSGEVTTNNSKSIVLCHSCESTKMNLFGNLLSTHPSHESRLKELTAFAEELMPQYLDALDEISLRNGGVVEGIRNSDKLLPGVVRSQISEWSWDNFDESVYESNLLAINCASLFVGDKEKEILQFLEKMGRNKKQLGESS
jgi:hypothetical protein